MAESADWTDNPFAAPAEEAAPFNDPSVGAALGAGENSLPVRRHPLHGLGEESSNDSVFISIYLERAGSLTLATLGVGAAARCGI